MPEHSISPRPRSRRLRITSTGIAVACALVSMLSAAAAIAYAAIGSAGITNNSIRGIDILNGTIRGADVANASLTATELAPGAADFTKVYATASTTDTQLESDADGTALLSRSLPRGSYSFVATVGLGNGDFQNRRTASCQIDTQAVDIANETSTRLMAAGNDGVDYQQSVILGATQLASTTTVYLRCYGDATTTAYNARMIATRVGSVAVSGSWMDL